MLRSRLCHFVIDVPDLEQGVAFWSAALDAAEESLPEQSRPIYRWLRVPDSEIRILLQKTGDGKPARSACTWTWNPATWRPKSPGWKPLGATRWDHQPERGFDFWVLRDPWGNELCVLHPEFPELLARRKPWNDSLPAG